jgi:hypothetical protein
MFPEFRKRKMEITENGNLRLFAANRKWKVRTSVCLLQAETGEQAGRPTWRQADMEAGRHGGRSTGEQAGQAGSGQAGR